MRSFEEKLQDYIYDLCKTKNISPPDFRFRCFGDVNKFWSSNTNSYFKLDCVNYYASDTEDVKTLVSHIIDVLWEQATQPNHRIALYLQNIVGKGSWIDVTLGSCLFEDDGILGWNTIQND